MKVITITTEMANPVGQIFSKSVSDNIYTLRSLKIHKSSTLFNILNCFTTFFWLFKVPKSDIYLVNGFAGLFFGFLIKKVRNKRCRLIMRVNDSLFSGFNMNPLKQTVINYLVKDLDGAIAISNMVKQDILRKLPNLPIEVVYCFVKEKSYYKISPNFQERNILCLGIAPKLRKGTDIQVKVHKETLNKKMYVVGMLKQAPEIVEQNRNSNNLFFIDYQNPKKYFKKCLFLLHPSRDDAGANVVLEAMASGLIPIVSYRTGNKELVNKVSKELVINSFDPFDYAKKINELSKLPSEELIILSNQCKSIAKHYTSENQLKDFNKKFWKLANNMR